MRKDKDVVWMLALAGWLAWGMAGASTSVSGFVDASYAGKIDTREETFGLDQVEIDVIRMVGEHVVLRADLEWVKAGEAGEDGEDADAEGESWDVAAEQGFLTYTPSFLPELSFTLGKFNAPIGFEMLDAPDMYQYSHSLVFEHCLPTNLTGALFDVTLTPKLGVLAYVVNGWDKNHEHNDVKTFGGRVGYSLGEMGNFGISALGGYEGIDETGGRTNKTTVVDVDVTLTPIENLLIGGEVNLGTVDSGSDEIDDMTWTGFLVMAHYDFNEWLGLTGRFDMVDDPDAVVFEGYASGDSPKPLEETRSSFTLAPTFVLGEGMGALIELRLDSSTEDVFVDRDGKADDTEISVAFEMTYTFDETF